MTSTEGKGEHLQKFTSPTDRLRRLASRETPVGSAWSLVLAKPQSDPDHVGKGRVLDPAHLDVDIIKHWMTDCLTHHGARCLNPMKIWPTCPAWLVRVEQECVVPWQHMDWPFIALSYRWGIPTGVSVTPEIMPDLQQPCALEDTRFSGLMTTMVQHAIYLTSKLGMRYLWVDALCVVHGDQGTAAQLGLVGAICASATVTVVATEGCAQDGIAGLKVAGSASRSQNQQPFRSRNADRNGINFSIDEVSHRA